MADVERILIVDDSADDAELLARVLKRAGHELVFERVDTAEEMTTSLRDHSWDIVISDYSMPRFNGIEALNLLRQRAHDVPFILVSGTVGEEVAVQAMKATWRDFRTPSSANCARPRCGASAVRPRLGTAPSSKACR
jgi:DNA-binding NtrC family response regulator